MKEKSFELLKSLLLNQSAGGGSFMDEQIALAADIYCEINTLDAIGFKESLREIKEMVWSGEYMTDWQERQERYGKLIDLLKK